VNSGGPEKFVVPASLVVPVMLLLNNTKHDTEDSTSEAGTANFSGPPEFTPGVLVAQSLVFCVVFCVV
jgi:hypothetical protein